MFHPAGHPLERGWVGRIDGDRVVQLAAQTLQSFFTGGGTAREHAEYPLADVRLLAPVLHPPSIRVFDAQDVFAFANPAAIVGPEATVAPPPAARAPSNSLVLGGLCVLPRVAAVVGSNGGIGGLTVFAEWRARGLAPPKDRDFALGLGPVVVTTGEFDPNGLRAVVSVGGRKTPAAPFPGFDWAAARDFAAAGTTLRAGDLLAGPSPGEIEVAAGSDVGIEIAGIGDLEQRTAG